MTIGILSSKYHPKFTNYNVFLHITPHTRLAETKKAENEQSSVIPITFPVHVHIDL